ncbi:MAG: nucleotide exchange factor GrpE [Treponema sp.]|jgi:molecular chaperone GrpE|nr:nucleotide exchange factor GrpE [Treponema sp.]
MSKQTTTEIPENIGNEAPVSEDNGVKQNEGADSAQTETDAGLNAASVCGNPAEEAAGKTNAAQEGVGPEETIAALQAELAEVKDQYLRKAAEFENFRKRMNREKQDAIEFANQSLLLDLIPIIDDFERALKSAEGSNSPSQQQPVDFANFCEGISLIEKRLSTQLENKWRLKRFDSAGEVFDPNRHEAIMMEKSPEVSEPTVQEDFLKGYTLKDRVVRSAKVKVLMPENEVRNAEGNE